MKTNQYKIRCVCERCNRKQVRLVSDLLSGERCGFHTLKAKPCDGVLNYYSDGIEDAQLNMSSVMGYLNGAGLIKEPKLAELIDTVVYDVGQWMEAHETPQRMGWVDSKGLP